MADIESGEKGVELSYDELAEVDLDALDHIPDTELLAYFSDLAGKATVGQLRQVLGYSPGTGFIEFADLVASYAQKRCQTALMLRGLRDS